MEQSAFDWGPKRRLFTVTELSAAIRGTLAVEFSNVWVSGEISGLKEAPSGHLYFTLKDEGSQIRCACFRMTVRYLRFRPKDGVAVIARGRVDVYDARGEYQLIVDALEPRGAGALQIAFEQLKKQLAEEGLFDAGRKRPLPGMPSRIGIVTSPSGAVIRDMLHVLARRFPGLHIRLYPAQVQGEGSAEQVARGIEYFSRSAWAEVVIVARGGGSLEDLWTFNEESVARAIVTCAVPVISAVGHETDFTIADFVADVRAPTPSAAAEMVVNTRASVLERLESGERRISQAARYRVAVRGRRADDVYFRLRDAWRGRAGAWKRALDSMEGRVRRQDIRLKIAGWRRRLETAEGAAIQTIRLRLSSAYRQLEPHTAHLRQLSPLAVLERGYAIVENDAGGVVKSASDAPVGSDIRIRLAAGKLKATVTG